MDLLAFMTDLRSSMNRRAHRLDAQALADDYVADMGEDEIGDHFGTLVADWDTALEHAGHPDIAGRTTCPIDGETLPCRTLRGLAITYDVRPRP